MMVKQHTMVFPTKSGGLQQKYLHQTLANNLTPPRYLKKLDNRVLFGVEY